MNPVELACACGCELAEGPVWHDGALYWVDILRGDLYRWQDGEVTQRRIGGLLGAAVPVGEGRWLLARDDGFSFFDWETGELRPRHHPEAHRPANRFNDGKCDPQGRFWAGTMNLRGEPGLGALYVLDAAPAARVALEGVTLSNGLGWSPDGRRFYHIDTPTRRIDVFAFDGAAGTISGRQPFHEVPAGGGFPDGMTVDADGNLWVALWGAGAVVCLDAGSGRERARITLPVTQPTSCTFGGENLETLFITSAWEHLTPEQRAREPQAGHVFRVHAGVRGLPVNVFRHAD